MKHFILVFVLLATPAAAQQFGPGQNNEQQVFLGKSLAILQQQRNSAMDDLVNLIARTQMLQEQILSLQAALQAKTEELEKAKEGKPQ